MRKRAFGELELEVLKMVRELEKCTVRNVYEALGKYNQYTTIMTVMNRLVQKGDLERKKKGRLYEYWLSPEGSSSVMGLLDRLRNQLFQGNPSDLIHYLIESSPELMGQELDKLETLINKKKKNSDETPSSEE